MDPPRFRRKLVDLLEFYADRTRRPGSVVKSQDASAAYNVPRPVMRILQEELSAALGRREEVILPLAQELWDVDFREPRILALHFLQSLQSVIVLDKIDAWLKETRDPTTLQDIASIGLERWSEEGYPDFEDRVRIWLNSRDERRKLFGIHALTHAAGDEHFRQIPLAFELMGSILEVESPNLRRSLDKLLARMIARSPAEAAHFVLKILKVDPALGRQLARRHLASFPSHHREALERALKG
jgi:hypothetical protein